MKQTAIEWLKCQMLEASMDRFTGEMYIKLPKDAFKQAKAMEKRQIIEAFKQGISYWNGDEWKLIDIEQYYKGTYGFRE